MASASNGDVCESTPTPDESHHQQLMQLTPLGERMILVETRSTRHAQNVRDHSMCMFGTCQKSLPLMFADKDIACCYRHYKCAIYRMRHNMCCICGAQCDDDNEPDRFHVCGNDSCQVLAQVKFVKYHETLSLFTYA